MDGQIDEQVVDQQVVDQTTSTDDTQTHDTVADTLTADIPRRDDVQAAPEPDITKHPQFMEVQRQLAETQQLQQTLMEDPDISSRIYRKFGMPEPQRAPDLDQEMRSLAQVVRHKPELADAAMARMEEIRNIRNQEIIAKSTQEAVNKVLAPMMLRNRLTTDPQFEQARPFVDTVVGAYEQYGLPPEVTFNIIGHALKSANWPPPKQQQQPRTQRPTDQYVEGAGGIASRSPIDMSEEDWDKLSKQQWKDQFR